MRNRIMQAGLLLGFAVSTLSGCSTDEAPPEAISPVAPSPTQAVSPNAAQHTSAPVSTHPSQGPVAVVPGATAKLATNDSGAHVTLTTSGLAAGHPHTVWFVALNRPDQCLAATCTTADVLFRTGTKSTAGRTTPSLRQPHFLRTPSRTL